VDAFAIERVDQFDQFIQCFEQRGVVQQLRADVAVDADHVQVGQACCGAVGVQRIIEGHAELVRLQAGRDVWVGLRIDVRVHAQRDRGALAHAAGHRVQAVQFRDRFDVEAQDAFLEREAHLGFGLADAREDGLARVAAGCDHAQQFAAGDDVEAGAFARQQVEDGEVRIGLHRVADEGVAAFTRVAVGGEVLQQGRLRIDIGRRAEFLGNAGQWGALGVQDAVLVRKMRHGSYWTGTEAGSGFGVVGFNGVAGVCAAGLAGGLGMYSGPVWPQPARLAARPRTTSAAGRSAVGDFTIRITV
jgi:hypothetical protein